jgi:TatA/E family protein of Tat protein translocase
MFGIGGTELFLILLFAFLIIGPDKLPKAGRTLGRAIRQFRNAQDEMNKVIKDEVYDPLVDDEPLKNPTEIITGKKKTAKKQVKTVSSQNSETFAERRARLAKERAERTAAEGAVAAPAAVTAAAGAAAGSVSGASAAPRGEVRQPTAATAPHVDTTVNDIDVPEGKTLADVLYESPTSGGAKTPATVKTTPSKTASANASDRPSANSASASPSGDDSFAARRARLLEERARRAAEKKEAAQADSTSDADGGTAGEGAAETADSRDGEEVGEQA